MIPITDREKGELQRVLATVDGRDFLYNFFLSSCGVDFIEGIPSGLKGDYDVGVKKSAIDFFNLALYHCPEMFRLMLDEQKQRRSNNG